MDINVYNKQLPVMNPSDLSMIWMGHYAPERPMLIDDIQAFSQQGLMEDLTQQTHAMDMNPMMGLISGDYSHPPVDTGLSSGNSIAPDFYGLHGPHQSQQNSLDNYDDDDEEEEEEIDDDGVGISGVDGLQYDIDDDQSNSNMILSTDNNGMVDGGDDVDDDEGHGQLQNQMVMTAMDHNHSDGIGGSVLMEYPSEYQTSYFLGDDNDLMSATTTKHGSGATIATQTRHETYKKIEPIKRPGLILKTPIAYQGDIDPSVIPIQRDGMAVCLRCGAIGVKHSFYTRERRYCSIACARGYTGDNFTTNTSQQQFKYEKNRPSSNHHQQQHSNYQNQQLGHHVNELNIKQEHLQSTMNYRFKMSNVNDDSPMLYRDLMPHDEVPQIPKLARLPSPCPQDEKIETVRRRPSELNSFDWSPKLNDMKFFAAAVTCFKHAPGYDIWSNIGIGMKVEVENTDCDNNEDLTGLIPHSFWVGTVLTIFGYKAQIRYEGFDKDSSHDFWVNLCSAEVHPVGWCATRGKPLIPPRTIENKYNDWKTFLVKRLSNARTLPSTFYNKINDSLKSRFRCGLHLEVVDKNRISHVRLATIHKIVGKRLYVRYFDSDPSDNGFWCHEDSPLIHPVGWATTVGHNLSAPQDYLDRMQGGDEQLIESLEDDATIDLFKMNFSFEDHYLEERSTSFLAGMKLEAIDPLNLSSICVATVMAVLKFGYMMIRIDTYDPDVTGADWFCYHEKSPCIFPVGFCEANNIPLTPPKDYTTENFNWNDYLEKARSLPAGEHLFCRDVPKHGFKEGMKLECADLMDPKLVCVATISRIVGRLLKVHFDGWEDEYDQWLDSESPDIYPVGWCDLVNHKLEGPPVGHQIIKCKPKVSPKVVRKRGKGKQPKKPKLENNGSSLKVLNPTSIKRQSSSSTVKKLQHIFEIKEPHSLDEMQPEFDPLSMSGLDDSDFNIKMEPKQEIYDFHTDTESFSSEQPSPSSSIRSELKFCLGDERLKGGSHSSMSSSSPQQPAPPIERKATSYINSLVNSVKYIPRILDTNNTPDTGGGGGGGGGGGSSGDHTTGTNVSNATTSSTTTSTSSNTGRNNDNSNGNNLNELSPDTWNQFDVAQFLRVNDCTSHCDTFSRNKIDGRKLLELTKDEIIEMLGMKVGPALKIYDLIQQLKCKMDPAQSRKLKASLNKKFL